MSINAVVEVVDRLFLENRARSLSDLEREIIRGTLKNLSYVRIGEQMGFSPNTVNMAGSKLWSDLSEILGTAINKRNFKSIVEKIDIDRDGDSSEKFKDFKDLKASSILQLDTVSNILNPSNKGDVFINIGSDSLESERFTTPKVIPTDNSIETPPECFGFSGREEELKTLHKQILEEGDRLITILGFPGIGKTALSLKLAEQMKPHFDAIVYRSLQSSPTLYALLVDILESLGHSKDHSNSLEKNFSRFKKVIQHRKILFILDDLDRIFAYEELAGKYHDQQEKYQLLFETFATLSHQSCLILCSREKPLDFAQWERAESPLYSLELKGSKEAAIALFHEKKFQDKPSWQNLIDKWQGNPLQLQEASLIVQNLFDGDAGQFVAYSEDFVGNNLQRKIEQHCDRLSESEKDVIKAFADIEEPLPIGKVMSKSGLLPAEFLNVVQSLQNRFCLETEQKDKIKHLSLPSILKSHLKSNPLEF